MKLFLRSILFSAIASFAPLASGQTLYWTGGTTGEFNNASNWNTVAPNVTFGNTTPTGTSAIPGPTNIAIIDADLNNGSVVNDLTVGVQNTPVVITLGSVTPGNNVVQGLVASNYFFWNGSPTGPITINNTSGRALNIAGTGNPNGDFLVDGAETLNFFGPLRVSQGTIVIGDNTFNTLGAEAGSGTLNLTSSTFNFDPAAGQTTSMILGYSQTGVINGTSFGTALGTVTQGTNGLANTTTTGNLLVLGYNGGTGNWSVTNGSLLQTGSQATVNYVIQLGANGGAGGLNSTGSLGTLTLTGTSAFNLGNATASADLQLGTLATGALFGTTGGTGVINQNGTSTVNIQGTSTVEIGAAAGGKGTYNLNGGTLNITSTGNFGVGSALGATGTLTQTGGSLIGGPTSSIIIGDAGTGTYNMSGGTADFQNGFTVGNQAGSSGTVRQSGGMITSEGAVVVGAAGSGTLELDGGVFSLSTDNLQGTGAINFGGGTLKFTGNSTPAYNYIFNSNLIGNTSTIDTSATTLTSFQFTHALTGNGGISLVGNGTTEFAFASQIGGTANSYFGTTGIFGGTLDASIDDLQTSNNIIIGSAASPANLNLSMPASGSIIGTISGNGNLNVNFNAPNETLSLTNTSSTISSVNIVLGANTGPNASATPGTLQVFGGSYGTISDNGSNSNVEIGDNTGVFSGNVVFGNATYTGLTTVNNKFSLTVTGAGGLAGSLSNAGIVNVQTIGGDVTDNSGLINVSGPAGIVGGVGTTTANTGSITATQIGGLLNNGAGGFFTATGPINSTTVGGNVVNDGTLITTSPLVPGGSPATPNATFTIGGTLTQSGTGTLTIRVGNGTADEYLINGGGTSNVAGKVYITGYGNGAGQVIINDAGGTLNAAGLTPTFAGSGALFTGTISQVGNTVVLNGSQIGTAQGASQNGVSLTSNELAVAGALDPVLISGAQIPTLGPLLNTVQANQIPTVLDQLSPQSLQYARNIAFENSTFLMQRMNSFDADLRSGYAGLDTSAISLANPGFETSLGRSLTNLFASNDSFHSTAPNGVNYYPGGAPGGPASETSPSEMPTESTTESTWNPSSQVISDSPNPYLANQNPAGPEAPKMNEFIGGDAVLADLNQDQSAQNAPASKARYTAEDLTAGVGFRVTPHLTAGVLFNYNHTDAKTDSFGSRTRVDSYAPGLFATYAQKGFYANGLFSFGYNDYSNSRAIPLIGPSTTANSSPNGQQYVAGLSGGYDFHPSRDWVVGPAAGLTYTHLDIDHFTETGAPEANLDVHSQSADSLRSQLGGHVVFQTNTGDVLLQPNATVMWQHEFLADSSGITSNFNDFSSNSFTIQTAAPSRDSALIGLGLTATLNTSMALYLNYLADVGASDYFAQTVYGGLKARF